MGILSSRDILGRICFLFWVRILGRIFELCIVASGKSGSHNATYAIFKVVHLFLALLAHNIISLLHGLVELLLFVELSPGGLSIIRAIVGIWDISASSRGLLISGVLVSVSISTIFGYFCAHLDSPWAAKFSRCHTCSGRRLVATGGPWDRCCGFRAGRSPRCGSWSILVITLLGSMLSIVSIDHEELLLFNRFLLLGALLSGFQLIGCETTSVYLVLLCQRTVLIWFLC